MALKFDNFFETTNLAAVFRLSAKEGVVILRHCTVIRKVLSSKYLKSTFTSIVARITIDDLLFRKFPDCACFDCVWWFSISHCAESIRAPAHPLVLNWVDDSPLSPIYDFQVALIAFVLRYHSLLIKGRWKAVNGLLIWANFILTLATNCIVR